MLNNIVAVDKKKATNKKTMQEMNEQYKDCPTRENLYEVNGMKVIIVSHFTGTKDLNEVLYRNAVDIAMSEMLAPEIQSRKF